MSQDPAQVPAFEDYPLTRAEYLGVMSHFYRGEIGRADAWRARLDPTTNWAVVTAGGMLSIAFAGPDHSHITLLLAIALVSVFLGFEARRFRYFDVWRSRVRMLEENFFIPIIRRNLVSPRADWREFVAQDLDHPKFKISFLDAVGIRLRYNYIWIYFAILIAWLAKLYMDPIPALRVNVVFERMRVGPLDGKFVLATVLAFYAAAVWLAVLGDRRRGITDEIHGIEREMDHWKT
ncbi:MAG TPA: DUF2270 domain-containing protein [Gemmatimonadota bacterium]